MAVLQPLTRPCTDTWQWAQHWSDLLFTHWQVPERSLRPHVPRGLEMDTHDGSAWVSLVAFRLAHVRHRWLPSCGLVTNTLELNLRTYVLCNGAPGIYFLSIHASKRLVIGLARLFTPLPYTYAKMSYERNENGSRFQSRSRRGLHFDVRFEAPVFSSAAASGSLSEWLLERYRLYAADGRRNLLLCTPAQHETWTAQETSAQVLENNLGSPFGLSLATAPDLVHYSPGLPALLWPFARVNPAPGGPP